MPLPLVSSFLDPGLGLAPTFIQAGLGNLLAILAGRTLRMRRHAVTGLIVSAGAAGEKRFSARRHFFGRAVWSLDSVGRVILELALRLVPKVETVLLAAGDSECSVRSVSRRLPPSGDLVGRMPVDAALHAALGPKKPGRKGRPPKKGARLPNPAELPASRSVRWTKTRADMYGKPARVWFKVVTALRCNSAGGRMLGVVVAREPAKGYSRTRLCLVIWEAETAQLRSGQKKRFSRLEDSLAVPLPNCQTQPRTPFPSPPRRRGNGDHRTGR